MNGTVSNKLLNKLNNKLVRNFKTTIINQEWVKDISEFKIASGKLYLSPVMDIHTNEIISYKVSKSPDLKQIMDMMEEAINKFDNLEGLIMHSDQGWQYQHNEFYKILEELEKVIDEYIDYYNNERISIKLKGLIPA